MAEHPPTRTHAPPDPADADGPRHRSGAVARMLRMPVATLQVWERRYGLTQATLSPSGHRLYGADEVRRLALLKQLCDLGHAIGRLARLDIDQLRAVAATHAGVLQAAQRSETAVLRLGAPRAWRVAVVGADLGRRLPCAANRRRPASMAPTLPGAPAVDWLGPFADAAAAAQGLAQDRPDLVVLHQPRLHPGWLAGWQAEAPALAEVPLALLYRFAADSTCDALALAGVQLLREPQNDTVLRQWLHGVLRSSPTPWAAAAPTAPAVPGGIPPRRWDDAALADVAGLSSTIACECPRHIAELLMQLGHFEAYSAECEHRSPADADLHAYLRAVTGESRARFETALAHVARHEGLLLPETEKG